MHALLMQGEPDGQNVVFLSIGALIEIAKEGICAVDYRSLFQARARAVL
jgi:hypothetical protein